MSIINAAFERATFGAQEETIEKLFIFLFNSWKEFQTFYKNPVNPGVKGLNINFSYYDFFLKKIWKMKMSIVWGKRL